MISYSINNEKILLEFDFCTIFITASGTHQTYKHEIVTRIFTFVVLVLFSASIYSSFLCLDIVYCHAICRNFTALKHWKFSQLYDSTVYLLYFSRAMKPGYPYNLCQEKLFSLHI